MGLNPDLSLVFTSLPRKSDMGGTMGAMCQVSRRGMLIARYLARADEETGMQVLVNCDDHICCDEELIRRVEGVIEGTLQRFSDRLFRVEVRLRDLSSERPGDRDKVCSLEARMMGAHAVVAEHDAPTLTEAIHVAAGKLERLVGQRLRELTRALNRSAAAGHSPAPR